jgi:hypothetical protein
MGTTFNMDTKVKHLLREAAAKHGVTMSALVEEALVQMLGDPPPRGKVRGGIWYPDWDSGGHLVNINDRDELYEAMGETKFTSLTSSRTSRIRVLLFDANVLVHAVDDFSEYNSICSSYLEDFTGAPETGFLSWNVCYEFMRVDTPACPSKAVEISRSLAVPERTAVQTRFQDVGRHRPSRVAVGPNTVRTAVRPR